MKREVIRSKNFVPDAAEFILRQQYPAVQVEAENGDLTWILGEN